MQFQVGDQVYDAVPGDYVFAPRGIPHTFRIQSPVVRAITVCTPAGFEDWFRQLGTPATSFDLPETVEPPSEAERAKMLEFWKAVGRADRRSVTFYLTVGYLIPNCSR